MLFNNDEEVRKECEKLGSAGVAARLPTGYFMDKLLIAQEWLIQHGETDEEKRHQQIVRSAQLTAYASWVLAAITFLSVGWQIMDSREQRQQMKEQIEQQRKDSQAQRDDAKTLVDVQISVELDKQFDSLEMRQARKKLSTQLLNNKEVTETRVLDFFDKVGMYAHQGRIDQDTVFRSYSYWIERYWPALKRHVDEFRKQESDTGFYSDLEDLYKEVLADDAKDAGKSVGLIAPSKTEIHRFLVEESTLP